MKKLEIRSSWLGACYSRGIVEVVVGSLGMEQRIESLPRKYYGDGWS